MILELEFDAHSLSIAQNFYSSDTFVRMDPYVAAEFRCCGRECRNRELIKSMFFGKVARALAHGDDVGFLVDTNFPERLVFVGDGGRRQYLHGKLLCLR